MDHNSPEQADSTASIFNIPDQATIDRRDDAQFQYEIKRLIKKGEDIRIKHMQRHKVQKNIGLALSLTIMVCGAAGFGWFLLMNIDIIKAVACMVIAIAMPMALNIWIKDPIDDYKRDYKNIYMPELAQIMGGFDYHPTRGISENVLSKTGVTPAYEHYHSEDCFRGHYKGCKIIFSEAQLKDKKKQDLFNGILVLIELPDRVFEGHTIATASRSMAEDYAETRWSKLSKIDIKAENRQWDRFVVYSNKPEDAKLFLGEKVLKELAEADMAFGDQNMSAVFFRGKYIYLQIPHEADMFEASDLYLPVSTEIHAMECKKEIQQLLEIIDIFDLYATNQ